jgi:hypothetical protein
VSQALSSEVPASLDNPGEAEMGDRVLARALVSAWIFVCSSTAWGSAPLDATQVGARLAALSVPFVENTGQLDSRVAYRASLFAGALFVTRDGELVYALGNGEGRVALTERLAGNARPTAAVAHAARVSSFIGADASRHRSALRTYEHVSLGEVFDGVDVRLRTTGVNVEKIFTVRPHADAASIRIEMGGARSLALGDEGRLVASTAGGEVTFTAPVAFQTIGGRQVPVRVSYRLAAAGNAYGFEVGDYDRNEPLVIDPFLQSIYLGGTGNDSVVAVAVHPQTSEVYVLGHTSSNDFPETTGNAFPTKNSGQDGFVARLDPTVNQLLSATYIGSSENDLFTSLAISATGTGVYVGGLTSGTDFPMAGTPAFATHADDAVNMVYSYDAVIARFDASLGGLTAATYFGGDSSDALYSLTIDPASGDVFIVGITNSSSLPNLTGAAVDSFNGWTTGSYAARFDRNLEINSQTTYLSPTTANLGIFGVAAHPAMGMLYFSGYSPPNFDGVVGRVGLSLKGNIEILRVPVSLAGGYSASLNHVAIHPGTGDVYVGGATDDPALPATNGAGQPDKGGGLSDGIVARFAPAPLRLLQLSYFGGSGNEEVRAIAIHPVSGEIYITGETTSNDLPAKVFGAQASHGSFPGQDGYIARFNPELTHIAQTTYLGGTGTDSLTAIGINSSTGDVIVAGSAGSAGLPASGTSEYPNGGPNDAFVMRASADLALADATPNPMSFKPQFNVPPGTLRESNPQQISGVTVGIAASLSVSGAPGSEVAVSSGPNCSGDVSQGYISTPGLIANGSYVCVRHVASGMTDQLTRTDLRVGTTVTPFIVTTGTLIGSACSLDVDGNGQQDAQTDGLMLLRAMFGLTGTAVTSGAVGGGSPTRTNWADIRAYLNGNCGGNFGQ